MDTLLAKVKVALRIVTEDFDGELTDLINAALLDMNLAGVSETELKDALIIRAVITYCKMNFGEPDQYDRLKKSYDEQKAQLGMATGYTTWSS
jgi:hypothetical protein